MVSVIVPVFNAEKTLQRCVDSILDAGKQYKIELILVNDGSEDASDRICCEYATRYDNIIYLLQSNLGVSAARNNGIKVATGEWIHFVDSDDWVEPNIYKCIDEAGTNSEIDFIMFRYNSGKETDVGKGKGEVLKGTQILCTVLKDNQYGGYCWNKIFRREIMNKHDVFFDEGIKLCEDQLFLIQYLQYIRLGYVVSDRLYHYWVINGGNHYNLDKSTTAIMAYEKIMKMDFVKKEDTALLEAKINYASNCIKTIVRAVKNKKIRQAHEYKKLLKPHIGNYLKSGKPALRNKIVAVLILICPVI